MKILKELKIKPAAVEEIALIVRKEGSFKADGLLGSLLRLDATP